MKSNGAHLAIFKRFMEIDVQQAAMTLETLSEKEAAALLNALGIKAAASCLEHVMPTFAAAVLQQLIPEPANSILERISPDRSADIFRAFSEDSRKAVVEGLTPERKKQVLELLSYPVDSAGRLMKTDLIAFQKHLKVREAITRLRALAPKHPGAIYSYVVDPDGRLVGVLNMRDLLLAGADAAIESIMRTEVFALPVFASREELAAAAEKTHFLSIPIVDPQGRLAGAVHTRDLFLSGQEEASEDLQLMFGASAEERPLSSIRFKVKRRLLWLYINLGTAFVAASVVALFEDLIGRLAILAVFLPVVAGQGGNAGIQSLAVVMRGLAMREIRPGDAWKLIRVEVLVGIINGFAIGLVTGLVAWAWQGNPYLGVVIGLGMIVNMTAAGLAGASIPVAMKRLGFDPAQSSGIFVTTVTDVVGFFSFLGFASLFRTQLGG